MAALTDLTVCSLVAMMKSGETTAVQIADAVIERVNAQQALGAVAAFDADRLRQLAIQADSKRSDGLAGELTGIPLIVKDNIDTVDLPTTGGTGALQQYHPKADAAALSRLNEQGAIVAAKSVLHELAFGITSNNAVTGPARNPYRHDHIPGGSSGGTASAIASRQFAAGLGTDTGGSARIPAALCGVIGFRPTGGRYPAQGVIPISHTRDTIGVLARSVADVQLLDRTLAGTTSASPPISISTLRIGVPVGRLWDDLEPGVQSQCKSMLDAMAAAGATLVECDLESIWSSVDAIGFPVALYEVMRDLAAYLEATGTSITLNDLIEAVGSPDVKGILLSQLGDDAMPEAAYRAAMDIHRPQASAIYKAVFSSNRLDAIAFPTTPLTARPIGQDETVELNGQQIPVFAAYIRNTELASVIGAPGISLPVGLSDGLPVGLELDAAIADDQRLLAIAAAVAPLAESTPAP